MFAGGFCCDQVEPDGGSGELEWALTAGLAVLAVGLRSPRGSSSGAPRRAAALPDRLADGSDCAGSFQPTRPLQGRVTGAGQGRTS